MYCLNVELLTVMELKMHHSFFCCRRMSNLSDKIATQAKTKGSAKEGGTSESVLEFCPKTQSQLGSPSPKKKSRHHLDDEVWFR